MSIEHVTDHADQGVALLVSQFRDKPRIGILLRALLDQVQEAEDAAIALLERSIDEISGYRLDVAGRIVGRERGALDDAAYRVWIKARIAANRSSGLSEQLIALAVLVFGEESGVRLVEDFPAGFTLHLDNGVDGPSGVEFARLLRIAKAAGVRAQLHWHEDLPDEGRPVFRFAPASSTVADSPNGLGNGRFAAASEGTRGSWAQHPAPDPFAGLAADLVAGWSVENAVSTAVPGSIDSIPDASANNNVIAASGLDRPSIVLDAAGRRRAQFLAGSPMLLTGGALSGLVSGGGFYCWAIFAAGTSGAAQTILDGLSADEPALLSFELVVEADRTMRFSLRTSAVTYPTVYSEQTVALDHMHLVEAWLDPSDENIYLSIDGELATSEAFGDDVLPSIVETLGVAVGAFSVTPFNGLLRKVGIANRMPTAAERAMVYADYTQGVGS